MYKKDYLMIENEVERILQTPTTSVIHTIVGQQRGPVLHETLHMSTPTHLEPYLFG